MTIFLQFQALTSWDLMSSASPHPMGWGRPHPMGPHPMGPYPTWGPTPWGPGHPMGSHLLNGGQDGLGDHQTPGRTEL